MGQQRNPAFYRAGGREDNIIPFIVEGNRFQKTSTGNVTRKRSKEMSTELLGISVDEIGKHKAFLRVVATLLNLQIRPTRDA